MYPQDKKMRKRGFTLIELLVAMAVGGLVMTAAIGIIYQILSGTPRTNSQVIALADVNQAAMAIKNDLMMAKTTDLNSTPKSSANLSWIDYSSFESANNTPHASIYTLSGTQLRRTNEHGTVSIVGRRVASINFTQSGQLVTVVITASGGGASPQTATVRFSAHIRPEELEQ